MICRSCDHDITYFLVLFVSKYLYTNQLELVPKELDILEELKKLIINKSIVRLDRNTD